MFNSLLGRLYRFEATDSEFRGTNIRTVGPAPTGVAVSPDDTWVYVTNTADSTVSVRNTKTFSEKGPVPVGPAPTGVAGISFPPELPAITTQPANRTVTVGQSATFSVKATGTPPLSYQWRRRDTSGDMEDIPGATGVSHTIEKTTMAHHGAVFDVVVSNIVGPVPSRRATLTVTPYPVILTQPEDKLVTVGQSATFSVIAAGVEPLSYQWRRNGTVVQEEGPASSYTTPAAKRSDDGAVFDVVVSNPAGSVISNQVTLNVDFAPAPPPPDPDAHGFHRVGTLWSGRPGSIGPLFVDPLNGIGVTLAGCVWVYDLLAREVAGCAGAGELVPDAFLGGGFQARGGVGARFITPPERLIQFDAGGKIVGREVRCPGLSPGLGGFGVGPLSGNRFGLRPLGGLAYAIEGDGEGRSVSVGAGGTSLFWAPCPRVGGVPVDYRVQTLATHPGRSGLGEDVLVTLEEDQNGAFPRGLITAPIPLPSSFNEWFFSPLTSMENRAHPNTLVRSFGLPPVRDRDDLFDSGSARTGDLEARWEVDLTALCPSFMSHWVARTSDAVLTYCWDHRPPGNRIELPGLSTGAPQGYLIKVPLDEDGYPIPRPGTNVHDVKTGDKTVDEQIDRARDAVVGNVGRVDERGLVYEAGSGGPTALPTAVPPTTTTTEPPTVPPTAAPPTTTTTEPPAVEVSPDVRVLNATVRKIPTLSGPVTPLYDAESGRVFLLTADPANGAAVWVMDPREERFIGVATHGTPWSTVKERLDLRGNQLATGYNATLGRAYILNPGPDGGEILVVNGRSADLGGVAYPALEKDEVLAKDVHELAAYSVGGRHYVAVPVVGRGFVVLEDKVPVPGPEDPLDPDRLTTQRDEREGETVATLSGAGQAAGAHVVVAGGVTKTANTASPGCRGVQKIPEKTWDESLGREVNTPGARAVNPIIEALQFERKMFDDECLADVLAARGHREAYLGSSEVESGTATGAFAGAQSLRVPSSDRATGDDLREAGECGSTSSRRGATGAFDYTTHAPVSDPEGAGGDPGIAEDPGIVGMVVRQLQTLSSFTPDKQLSEESWAWVPDDPEERNSHRAKPLFDGLFGGYGEFCDTARDRMLAEAGLDASGGAHGPEGEGFPARAAECTESGSDSVRSGPEGRFPSEVRCQAPVPAASAASSVGALALPDREDPVVLVEGATGSIDSRRAVEDGKAYQVTEARAVATGVQIGPVSIGAVRTTAENKAGGRTGTASATLTREWCGVAVGAEVLSSGCSVVTGPEDPLVARVADEARQAYPKLRLSVPEAQIEQTPGGYQAVVTKDPGLQAADSSVNDDTSIVVPALEVTFVNDGAEGRNRWVVQLAGVEAEARYGINVLPTFSGSTGSGSFTSTKATPGARRVVPGRKSLPKASRLIEGEAFDDFGSGLPASGNPAQRFVTWVPNAIKDLLRLLIQHPLEFALLFLVFSLLATPPYLAYRRRTFLGVVRG